MKTPSTDRRKFMKQSAAALAGTALAGPAPAAAAATSTPGSFWPDGARLVISVSMQFEAGGEPAFGADSPFSGTPLPEGVPDLPARTWFQYGYREGIPRLLDLWDEFGIKVSSHMVGAAAKNHPELAKEIVKRGHEATGHGSTWSNQFDMTREQEKAFITEGVEEVRKVTGQTTQGYNCNWLRRSVNTLSILQELGFTYHIDDLSRDEPFIVPVNGRDFVIVPYSVRCNDIVLIEGRHFSSDQFFNQLKDEFDQLYREGAACRRQMSISTHDRIGGTPAVVSALRRFFTYVKEHEGVKYMRKDAIADYALKAPGIIREPQAT